VICTVPPRLTVCTSAALVRAGARQADHGLVAGQHLGHETTHAARHRQFGQALLHRHAQALALPVRVHDEGRLGQVGGRVDDVHRGAADQRLLAGAGHRHQRHFVAVVQVAQALHVLVRQAAQLAEEPGVDLAHRQPVEALADALHVGRHHRPQQHGALVLQPHGGFVFDRIGAQVAQLLLHGQVLCRWTSMAR
jgi:hypothetical protein